MNSLNKRCKYTAQIKMNLQRYLNVCIKIYKQNPGGFLYQNIIKKRKRVINIERNDNNERKQKEIIIPNAGSSGSVEGSGLARLFFGAGCEVKGFVANIGSNSQGETLSGRMIDEGSSH